MAQALWKRIVDEKWLDLSLCNSGSRHVDADTSPAQKLWEIGSGWIWHHTSEELNIRKVLAQAGFNEKQIQLAATQIIHRAVYPASELKSTTWIRKNSAV